MVARNGPRMDICTAQVSGNVVRDPESKGGVARLRVAFKTRTKNRDSGQYEDKSNFIDAICFGKTGEIAVSALTKGSAVVLTGRLEQNEWTDANGNKRDTIRILVDNLKLPPKGGAGPRNPAAAVVDELPF
jgi:single-strand DNA-binding protein